MKTYYFIFGFVCLSLFCCAQKKEIPEPKTYPKDDFRNPLDITNLLSGNFGELRTNHFHSGLDIKTNQREGLKVYAVGDGYVSRINVSPRGYGNALYIDHPNGYTSVYAHLQVFNDELTEYVRKYQYENQTFAVEIYPKPGELKVVKGDIVAKSGNSGGSGGPHLHFEIRDTKTEEIINPFYFGFDIPDTKAPSIGGLYLYAINGDVAGKKGRHNVNLSGGTISASGKIGVGVKTYDQQNGADNNNGTYQIDVHVNEEPVYTYNASRFSFDETRAINSVCDYEAIMVNNSWIYQCFVDAGNPLREFSNLKNNGIIDLEEGKTYTIKVTVSDYAGNSKSSSFKVLGKKPPAETDHTTKENYFLWNRENYFKSEKIELVFPKGIFYEDFQFDYKYNAGKHTVGHYNIPVHNYFTIAIAPEDNIPDAQLNKAIIVRQYQKKGAWSKSYLKGEYKNGKVYAESREFGIFSLETDNTKPTISALNIKENSTFTSANGVIKFKIDDSQSGIKGFSAFVDGKWILAEYDLKTKSLTINLNKEKVSAGSHQLELNVWDEKDNTSTFKANFSK